MRHLFHVLLAFSGSAGPLTVCLVTFSHLHHHLTFTFKLTELFLNILLCPRRPLSFRFELLFPEV